MIIELKNIKIGSSNFGGRKDRGYPSGRFFLAVISENDAERLQSIGYSVRSSKSGSKFAFVKIPNFGKMAPKTLRPHIHAKIRGEDDLVLDYSSAGILDYATIRKANIVVDARMSEKLNKTVLYLLSMDAYINKNISMPVSGFLPIIEEYKSQARADCFNELKNIIDGLEEK